MQRRSLVQAGVAGAAATVLGGCSGDDETYAAAAAAVRAVPGAGTRLSALELVRLATLAASSHNTQPWLFRIAAEGGFEILPDLTRRTPIVDPDDHHLWVSLGCATENLLLAARASGRHGEVRFDAAGDGRISVGFDAGPDEATPRYAAIGTRQCSRSDYDGAVLPHADLDALVAAAEGPGVRALLLTDGAAIEPIVEYVARAAAAQWNDPAFRAELESWLRFAPGEALARGDGLYAAASGHLTAPRWLGRALFGLSLDPADESARYARQIRSSSGLALFVSDADDRQHWIEVGRSYQRFALEATARGIRNAFVNPPVEFPAIRAELMTHLGLARGRIDLIVRFGYGPALPPSPRRPVAAVLA